MAKNKPLQFYGDVGEGKLTIHKRDLFDRYVKTLKGLVRITVEKVRKKRSIPQNNYYWICVTVIGAELGYTKDEMHAALKAEYLTDTKIVMHKKNGIVKEIKMVKSTSQLYKYEMSEYMQQVIIFAADFGIELPDPEDYK